MEHLFTPGPWRLDDAIHGEALQPDYHCIDAGRGYLVAGGNGFGVSGFMTIHDARLITAAPDLLAALQSLLALVEGECPSLIEHDHHAERARAAISKALGGSHVGS
jgi:hypothetical protein